MGIKKLFLTIVIVCVACSLATNASSQGGSWTFAGQLPSKYATQMITITITQQGNTFPVKGQFFYFQPGASSPTYICPIVGTYFPATYSQAANIRGSIRCGENIRTWSNLYADVKSQTTFDIVTRNPLSGAVLSIIPVHRTKSTARLPPVVSPTLLPPDISGVWQTDSPSTLTITQSGAHIEGTITYSNGSQGHISGDIVLAGTYRLNYRWAVGDSQGTGTLAISDHPPTMYGQWYNTDKFYAHPQIGGQWFACRTYDANARLCR